MEKAIKYLGWLVLLTLSLAIARQLSEQRTIYLLPDSFGRIFSRKGWDGGALPWSSEGMILREPSSLLFPSHGLGNSEGFTGGDGVSGLPDTTGVTIPAEAALKNPRQPYALLNGVLPEKTGKGNLTAKRCYDKDFLAQSNKVGNYIQRTNNFPHAAPDSCSTL